MGGCSIRTVAIIGAGFCGTMAAVHLLRASHSQALRILLIEDSVPGKGLAYKTTDQNHLLNVPAGGMSAFEESPEDFLSYLKNRFGAASASDFWPRQIYGEYLQQTLREAIEKKSASAQFSHIQARAIDIDAKGSQWRIIFSDHTELHADKIILATGNMQPKTPAFGTTDAIDESARYISDPWCDDFFERIDWEQPLLLLGTGLTAVDIVLKLAARKYKPTIYAISRRGLNPTAHRGLSGKPAGIDLSQLLSGEKKTIAQLMNFMRDKALEIENTGHDWRDVIAALRPHIPQLWQQFSYEQRAQFIRHGAAYWDVHRHRLAPPVAVSVQELLAAGQLIIGASRLEGFSKKRKGFEVKLRARGASNHSPLTVGNIINCTGPNTDLLKIKDPLTQALLRRELLKPDVSKLGIHVAEDYSIPGSSASAARSVYYVGPWLKAKYWEATAVPELRVHVRNVVNNVLSAFSETEHSSKISNLI